MSYRITVVVKDGVASIDESGTTVNADADGKYVVNGHVPVEGTRQVENVQVTRSDKDGKTIVQASGTHYK